VGESKAASLPRKDQKCASALDAQNPLKVELKGGYTAPKCEVKTMPDVRRRLRLQAGEGNIRMSGKITGHTADMESAFCSMANVSRSGAAR
jgi:hypothetical protein